MRSIRQLCLVLLSIGLLACSQSPRRAADTSDPAARVAALMQGHYDSREQAAADTQYFAISLSMVPIWPQRSDGHWLYVEQAVADTPNAPYRQRVYRVYNGEQGGVVSEVYTIAEQTKFVRGWETGTLATLQPEALQLKDGCSVHLRPQADEQSTWRGATIGNGCASERSGAAYATAEVLLERDRMSSWDRGFDQTGKQVWGATAGSYVFVKRFSAEAP